MEPQTRKESKKTSHEKKRGGNRLGTGAGTRAKEALINKPKK
jgi:hypothetical protein